MEKINAHIANIVKQCNVAEKEWSNHMKQPEYCLKKNFVLYKRYIRLFNHLQELDVLLSKIKNENQ